MVAGCSGITRFPVPEHDHLDVQLLGRTDLRFWGDERPEETVRFDTKALIELYSKHRGTNLHYLAISGGGANGAYGAGLLAGWSETGTRPEFTLVTGISTGALTAPFAFLGSNYDDELEEVYTTLDTTSVFSPRKLITLFKADALADSTPLARVIEKHVNDAMVQDIGREGARGRILLIGTTNLDASRPVVWDLTRIAASGHPGAGDLIREILLASASIPGVFPPVYVDVETAGGRRFDEMHVDGGVSSQMFLYPSHVDMRAVHEMSGITSAHAYLIRNARVHTAYAPVQPRLRPIAARTVRSLIRTQGIGDFYRIYSQADRDGIGISVTWIPSEAVKAVSSEAFDPVYMRELFDYGRARVLAGEAWTDVSQAVDL